MNAFITEGIFPKNLKRAHVTPSLEKGNSENPIKYRSILVTCALSKIFENILKEQNILS